MSDLSPLSLVHLQNEAQAVKALADSLAPYKAVLRNAEDKAAALITSIRASKPNSGEIEQFLKRYPLSSDEGLALMTLAEAALRTPDAENADLLIEEKLTDKNWSEGEEVSDWVLSFAAFGLNMAQATLKSPLARLSSPAIRQGVKKAIEHLGRQFVLGQSIEEGMAESRAWAEQGYRLSYDMLGEGARTEEDAKKYFEAYAHALEVIGNNHSLPLQLMERPSVSVKLSALYPRYQYAQADFCVPVMAQRLLALATLAKQYNLRLIVDAEEADRLELSLKIISHVSGAESLRSWQGLGMAVQAYDKRAFTLIDELKSMAVKHNRHLQIRLVKGAYWDSEIKRAQIAGLKEYPLFTRKNSTDLSYLAVAQKLLDARKILYPLFGTHNAYTAAAIYELAGADKSGFEMQRLHGMGAALGDLLIKQLNLPVSIYAPIGSYADLLPYLVRRMLENGANSSFVHKLRDEKISIQNLIANPLEKAVGYQYARNHKLPLPQDIYGQSRKNSAGIDLSHEATRKEFLKSIEALPQIPLLRELEADKAVIRAGAGFKRWSSLSVDERNDKILKLADELEDARPYLCALLMEEGRKIIPDALSEIREAVDFCRYYVAEAKNILMPMTMTGPTGEINTLSLTPRGVFACISPWNFPLAIFLGQVVAALVTGNAVVAKPAEQTPKIAFYIRYLMDKAGIEADACVILEGDGKIGADLVAHKDIAGVVFTGSTEVARHINRALAAKDGAITPLIAETGGLNAMVVQSTALPEQVVDDVLQSAFGSAGQRCSALRLLCLQEDIADKFEAMLKGAMAELKIGNPRKLSTDIGPVIDAEAFAALSDYIKKQEEAGHIIAKASITDNVDHCVPPVALRVDWQTLPQKEIFGPVLHILRFKAGEKDRLISAINSSGYGLTFGVQSRIKNQFLSWAENIKAGNIYINRGMTGAVVGVQPFGGQGLSGTGPKAGGPHYLPRFCHEKTISNNIAALGGNLELMMLEEE